MCLNYSILFSNVPRLQSFLLDNSDILRIDYKAHIMWITLTAMICPLGLCTILLTDPYAPLPISPRSLRSSAVKSQCCSGEIFSFPEDSMLCVRIRSLKRMSQCFLHTETASPNGTAKIVTVAEQVSRTLPICNWLENRSSRPQTHAIGWLDCQDTNSRVWASFLQITYCFLCIFNIKTTHVPFNKHWQWMKSHMCGFWNGGFAVVMGSRAVGLTGGFAKFNLSALRLPVKEKNIYITSDCFDV